MSRDGWVRKQIAFLQAHEMRTAGAERRRVKLRWWTPPTRTRRPAQLMAPLSQLWSGRPVDPGTTFVALYEAADPVGTPPFLVFRAESERLPGASGRAVATVVGDTVPGGVLVVETRHGTVVPMEPPSGPADDAPAWSETDA
jgi:hypothetical protein